MRYAVITTSIFLTLFPAWSAARECIPVYRIDLADTPSNTYLHPSGNFNAVMTQIAPQYFYLDVKLSDEQAKELVQDSRFTVSGDEFQYEFDLTLDKANLARHFSPRTKELTGYWEISHVSPPYHQRGIAELRPFKPTLKKCIPQRSGWFPNR